MRFDCLLVCCDSFVFPLLDTHGPKVYLTRSVRPKTNVPVQIFQWTSSEPSEFECKLDGKVVPCNPVGRSRQRGSFQTPNLPDGKHSFSISAVDDHGNKGEPKVVNWDLGR